MARNWLIVLLQTRSRRFVSAILLLVLILAIPVCANAQSKVTTRQAVAQKKKQTPTSVSPAKPKDEITRLREEFIKATGDYKASFERLRLGTEGNDTNHERR